MRYLSPICACAVALIAVLALAGCTGTTLPVQSPAKIKAEAAALTALVDVAGTSGDLKPEIVAGVDAANAAFQAGAIDVPTLLDAVQAALTAERIVNPARAAELEAAMALLRVAVTP